MTTGASSVRPQPRPRSRVRTFLPLGIAAWLVLEIWLLTLVAHAAGGPTVFLLLVAGGVGGAAVIKRAGRRAFRNLTETLQAQQRGTAPESGGQGEGNGLLMLAGLLLMIPGLISDLFGLLLLLPPVRAVAGRFTGRAVERGMRGASPGTLGNAFQQARIHRPDGKVVQGEVIRDDAPPAWREADSRPPLNP
ncbi:FxsA family membrane protein [Streptomyces sp. NPDC002004]